MKITSFWLVILLVCVSCRSNVPVRPEKINIGLQYEIDSLDPHDKATLSAWAILANFYQPLVTTDASMHVRPALAKGWENPDVYTWVFHLQPNVHFHNGKQMDAGDVVYSFERLIKSDDLGVTTYLTDVSEIKELDPLTISVHTKSPLPIFLNRLSNIAIVPRGATTEQLKNSENGTGPYRLVQWKKDDFITMIRDDHYWGDKATIQNVTYFLNRKPEDAVQQLRKGNYQFIQYDSKRFEGIVKTIGHYHILRQDNYYLKHLSYDVWRDITPYCKTKPNPFKNPLVRKAIYSGIDRARLIADLPTYAVTATQPVPPFVFGFNPQIMLPAYDPAASRALLAKAGLPKGFEVTLHVRQILRETGELIRDQLAKIGIKVDLQVLPDTDFFARLDTKDVSFFLSRVGATVGDASDVLEPQIHSFDNLRHYGVRNYSGYTNETVDRQIENSAEILKVDDRREALQSIMSTLMTDLPWIPLYIDQDVYALDDSFSWQPRHDSFVFAYEISYRE